MKYFVSWRYQTESGWVYGDLEINYDGSYSFKQEVANGMRYEGDPKDPNTVCGSGGFSVERLQILAATPLFTSLPTLLIRE